MVHSWYYYFIFHNHPKLKHDIGQVKFEDVFSDEQKQCRAFKVFKQIMEKYDRMKSEWIWKTRNPIANNQVQQQHLCCHIWYFLYNITLDLYIINLTKSGMLLNSRSLLNGGSANKAPSPPILLYCQTPNPGENNNPHPKCSPRQWNFVCKLI